MPMYQDKNNTSSFRFDWEFDKKAKRWVSTGKKQKKMKYRSLWPAVNLKHVTLTTGLYVEKIS